jgi:DEAD/DEAH box helicase
LQKTGLEVHMYCYCMALHLDYGLFSAFFCCAQTGSGKTAAYVLPMIAIMTKAAWEPTKKSAGRGVAAAPMALILGPTRELVQQICEEVCMLVVLVVRCPSFICDVQ